MEHTPTGTLVEGLAASTLCDEASWLAARELFHQPLGQGTPLSPTLIQWMLQFWTPAASLLGELQRTPVP